MIISKDNAVHYQWGGACDAWTFLQSPDAIIKEELMPPGSEEQLHFHEHSSQFFYILEGEALFLLDGVESRIQANSGITVKENAVHKIANTSIIPLRFLVVTFPGNVGDRVNVG